MAKIDLPKGIASISGTLVKGREDKIIAKTFRKADGTSETRVYLMRNHQRATPVTEKELAIRDRFQQMAQEVARRIANGDKRPRKLIWADVKAQMQA